MTSPPPANQLSIVNVLLSSTVAVGLLTGISYFSGGAYTDGYRHVLGLDYLADLSPAAYMFSGAQVLLMLSYALVLLLGLTLAIASVEFAFLKWKLSRASELPTSILLIVILGLALLVIAAAEINKTRDLIASGSCPVANNGSPMHAFWLFLVLILAASFGFLFFTQRAIRLTLVVWGVLASTLALYVFSWDFGAARLSEKFQILEIGSTALQLPSKLLLLGSDEKNLVVLTPGLSNSRRPQPMYVLRSEIKKFSIIGTASINDFACHSPGSTSPPARN